MPQYEAWTRTGPRGYRAISTPGGELAIWSARQGSRRYTKTTLPVDLRAFPPGRSDSPADEPNFTVVINDALCP
ncbi:DUF6188 family protein [Nocardia sp. NPDC059228]|uniref:DUF6188 family protein n=1 Tax=Nocardia sp. NPDC059228 TaxID=3346777 RepID=UPI00367CB915